MSDAVRHRGPDDEGSWVDPGRGIALGFRRLSILDLSPAGHQPMVSESGRWVVILNGEIYNFQDLRAELEPLGHRFRGHSDTEVVLAAVEQWGLERALERLNGMFAFAFWDREQQCLHLVRDRLGEKPLYYGWCGGVFLFGSELKALRAHPAFDAEADRDSLAIFLRLGYIPAPYSIYRGIFKLPAATRLTIRPGEPGTLPDPVTYWDARAVVERARRNLFTGSPREATAGLDALLRDAVRMRMLADVPLGAFLSGGIDSSLVVSLMQAQSRSPVRTFSIGFHEAQYNEAHHAAAVARHLGTDHTELYVTPQEARDVIPSLPEFYDEPFADASQIPTHLVSRLARRHVTVSLSGDGGDELFGGYDRYFHGRTLWRAIRWMPRPARRLSASLLRAVPAGWTAPLGRWRATRAFASASPADRFGKVAALLDSESAESLYRDLVSLWEEPEALVAGSREPETILTDRRRWADAGDFAQRMMFFDMLLYLPEDIMVKVDRASMAVSLESRAPYLDPRVAEFAWRLPLALKIRNGRGKWILRQILAAYVPPALTDRPKMGFGVPIDSWLRGPLREWAETLLSRERLRREAYLDVETIRSVWEQHLSGQRNWQYPLWAVLMFQAWLEHSSVETVEAASEAPATAG
jgi:asparagine synthase (glutamine-hydrolysing)